MLSLTQLRRLGGALKTDFARYREDIALLALEEMRQLSSEASGKGRNPITIDMVVQTYKKTTGRAIKPTDMPSLVRQATDRVERITNELRCVGILKESELGESEVEVEPEPILETTAEMA